MCYDLKPENHQNDILEIQFLAQGKLTVFQFLAVNDVRKAIAVYSEDYMKPITTLYGRGHRIRILKQLMNHINFNMYCSIQTCC
jgi:hypothetical protein